VLTSNKLIAAIARNGHLVFIGSQLVGLIGAHPYYVAAGGESDTEWKFSKTVSHKPVLLACGFGSDQLCGRRTAQNAPLAVITKQSILAHMTTTLSQAQADFPRLVELASRGEDVVITVAGKPNARLTSVPVLQVRELSPGERAAWLKELEELRSKFATGKVGPTVEQILEEDRADQV
jgi:prevent-host-death family protein